jgi:hypothetical protein
MPVVTHFRVQQGFRPFIRSAPLSGLRGLGGIVPDQSIVIYQGRWQTPAGGMGGPMPVVRAIESALANDGLTVHNESVNAPTAASLGFNNIPFSITLTLQVTNGMGYGDPNDILSVINHEVYVATGAMPLAGSITSVQSPGGGQQPTGQPTISTAPDPNCASGMPYDVNGDACPGPAGSPQSWGAWLQNNGWWIAAAAVGLVLVPKFL